MKLRLLLIQLSTRTRKAPMATLKSFYTTFLTHLNYPFYIVYLQDKIACLGIQWSSDGATRVTL